MERGNLIKYWIVGTPGSHSVGGQSGEWIYVNRV